MKIKTFKFTIANAASHPFEEDKKQCWYKERLTEIDSPAYIDAVINDFIKDKKVISISTNTEIEHHHNNGRGNTVVALYTIVYNDMKTTTVSTH
jgi:hypothetical protein